MNPELKAIVQDYNLVKDSIEKMKAAIKLVEYDPTYITMVNPDEFSKSQFSEICLKGALADGHILPYLIDLNRKRDVLSKEIVNAAYLHSAHYPDHIYPGTVSYLSPEAAEVMLARDKSNFTYIPNTSEFENILAAAIKSTPVEILHNNKVLFGNNHSILTNNLIEALYHSDKLYNTVNIAKLNENNLLQYTEQFLSEKGWNQGRPQLDSFLFLNGQQVVFDDGNIILPSESVADIWNTLSDKNIAQLKTNFHIDYTSFEQQLNDNERWRLEEIVDRRREDNQNLLERLEKYESLYPNLPAVTNMLLPLLQTCKDDYSKQTLSKLLTVHLNYAGLMKNCPDYTKLAAEALANNWSNDELINKSALYQGVINHADKLIHEHKLTLKELLSTQNSRTISGAEAEAPKHGRGK